MTRIATKADLAAAARGTRGKNHTGARKTHPAMNVEPWKKHQETPLPKAKLILEESHCKVTDMIDTFSNHELFNKEHFAWTGTTTVGAYCVSATVSHYDWAMKKKIAPQDRQNQLTKIL